MADQPTIMVKKADGTFVRVPVSDLAKYKKQTAVTPASVSAPRNPLVQSQKPAQVIPPKQVQPKPVAAPVQPPAKVIIPKPPQKKETAKFTSADFASLLEDGDMVSSLDMPKTPLSRVAEADEVIKKITFFISPDNLTKLRQIVQVFLKDVRSETETRELLA